MRLVGETALNLQSKWKLPMTFGSREKNHLCSKAPPNEELSFYGAAGSLLQPVL